MGFVGGFKWLIPWLVIALVSMVFWVFLFLQFCFYTEKGTTETYIPWYNTNRAWGVNCSEVFDSHLINKPTSCERRKRSKGDEEGVKGGVVGLVSGIIPQAMYINIPSNHDIYQRPLKLHPLFTHTLYYFHQTRFISKLKISKALCFVALLKVHDHFCLEGMWMHICIWYYLQN